MAQDQPFPADDRPLCRSLYGSDFFVEIVSDAFQGKVRCAESGSLPLMLTVVVLQNQLARHRAINNLMADEFEQGLHALSLRTKTPAEWVKEQQH